MRTIPRTAPAPLPRTWPDGTKSIGKPRAGTARASRPLSVPTNDTAPPGHAARNASASAIPGNTWPPVPPPAIIRLGDKRVRSFHRDVDEHPDRREVEDEGAPAVAQERQDHPLGREHLESHHHVRERLHADDDGQPHGQVFPEGVACASRDPETHPYQG